MTDSRFSLGVGVILDCWDTHQVSASSLLCGGRWVCIRRGETRKAEACVCTRMYVPVCVLVCGRDRPGVREAGGGSPPLLEVEEGPGGKSTGASGLCGDETTHLPGSSRRSTAPNLDLVAPELRESVW